MKEASPRLSSKSSGKATRAQNSHFNLSTKGSFARLTCCLKAFYSSPYNSPCNGARIYNRRNLKFVIDLSWLISASFSCWFQ
jgi:hypothetical protein